jgi:hypothetical protein
MTGPGYDENESAGRRRGGAWWWWVLAALALLLIVILLLARGCGGDGGDGGDGGGERASGGAARVDTGSGSTAGSGGAADTGEDGETGGTGADGGGGETGETGSSGSGSSGALTDEGGRDLLALAARGGSLAAVADGRAARGEDVRVQSVVGDEVFWVGASEQERVLVHLVIGGESPPRVKVGQRAGFTGRLLTLPDGAPGIWGVEDSEGAAQVAEQGVHVQVDVADLDLSG